MIEECYNSSEKKKRERESYPTHYSIIMQVFIFIFYDFRIIEKKLLKNRNEKSCIRYLAESRKMYIC